MKRINVICVLLLLLSGTLSAQRVTLSEASIRMPAPPKAGENKAVWGVGCNVSEPLDGCSVVVLAGSEKDRNDAGMGKATFHKVPDGWQVLPVESTFTPPRLWIGLPVDLNRQVQVRVFTIYVVDRRGAEVSERLYYLLEE